MSLAGSSSAFSLTPESFWKWGRYVLFAGLACSVLLLLLIVRTSIELTLYFGLGLFGAIIAWSLYRRPLLNLCVTLGGFAVVTDFEAGLQIPEILYGLYYLSFLGHWFLTRIFLYKDRVFETATDKALGLLLVWITSSFALTIVLDGDIAMAISEWASLSLLAFYFPIKEACTRYRKGPEAILAVLLFLGLFVSIRNLVYYKEILISATAAWNITAGRVVTNEILLVVPGLAALTLVLHQSRWSIKIGMAIGTGLLVTALILTQSRAYWLDYALGVLVLVWLLERREKIQLATLVTTGVLISAAVMVVVLGDLLVLIFSGIVDRFFTLGSAATQDISLINRFYESKAVLEKIAANPIVGYGLGVPYEVFDIIEQHTKVKMFAHNGFLMIWYKFGIIGLGLLLFVWVKSGVDAFEAYKEAASHRYKVFAMIIVTGLACILPSTNTSVQFYLSDTVLAFAILIGWSGGMRARIRRVER